VDRELEAVLPRLDANFPGREVRRHETPQEEVRDRVVAQLAEILVVRVDRHPTTHST
jgi:hypothetical protein